MSAFKKTVKSAMDHAVARVAPATWKWREAGSLIVLMYHRILPNDSAAHKSEQPGMCVSPDTFNLHLAELKRHFEFVYLDDWLRRSKHRDPLPRLACAITFDDGWRDNFDFALPALRRHGAPATIFLVSGYVGSTHRFWPNRLAGMLTKAYAGSEEIKFPQPFLPVAERVLAQARRRGELRSEDTDALIDAAKQFSDEKIRELMCAAESGDRNIEEPREILSLDEITQLSATGLVRFGSHTETHFRLGGHPSPGALEREIVGSRDTLQDICGRKIDLFCYPNGETSPEAIDLARRHYLGAVTTRKGWHTAYDDPHLVNRIGVHEAVSNSPQAFLARVSGWL